MLLAASGHAGDNPSTSDIKVGSKKGRVKFPFRLCEGSHRTYLFPHMDEGSHLLENVVNFHQKIPTSYHKLFPNLPLVYELVNRVPSSVTLVGQVIDLVPSSLNMVDQVIHLVPSPVYPNILMKSELDTTQVFLVTLDSSEQGVISPIPTERPLSNEVISIYWNRLIEPHVPSYMPFEIIVEVFHINICHSIVDEGVWKVPLSFFR
jgi:hypothetical protein